MPVSSASTEETVPTSQSVPAGIPNSADSLGSDDAAEDAADDAADDTTDFCREGDSTGIVTQISPGALAVQRGLFSRNTATAGFIWALCISRRCIAREGTCRSRTIGREGC